MKHKWLDKKHWIGLMACLLGLICLTGAAAENYSAGAMRLLRYEGEVEIFDAGGSPRFVMENVRFASGESMRTGQGGSASVSLDATKILSLDENSRVRFEQQGSAMTLTLTEGTLLLDVQEKLDENETLDIQTSTMTVGIRGTIVAVSVGNRQDAVSGQATELMVLEGTARLTYQDGNGLMQSHLVPAGQIATLTPTGDGEGAGVTTEICEMSPEDTRGFLEDKILKDPQMLLRVQPYLYWLEELSYLYPADGEWEWTEQVTLVAQSASKLYDGTPLTRSSDVLVYGLPSNFTVHASAVGSQTDAGQCANVVSSYAIYNSKGEDVTSHFPNHQLINGLLVVDPLPVTVWTGSAEKPYDGSPLTMPSAKLTTISGYEEKMPEWRNTSYVLPEYTGGQVMFGICGTVVAHATNPLTGETREINLSVGQKLTVYLSDLAGADSITLVLSDVAEDELPDEILRLYADNDDLLAQACQDAGWNQELMRARIAALSGSDQKTVEKNDLTIGEAAANRLMRDFTNIRINVDTEITNYNNRALGGEETRWVEVKLDESIRVTATGSQTEVGESENTYEIDWGSADPHNYVLTQELGTLKVTEAEAKGRVTLAASSASKVFDGTPLTAGVTAYGLPAGCTALVYALGSQTDAGTSTNYVLDGYRILNADGQDVTSSFHVVTTSGTLTVVPAALSISTGGGSKVYDGQPLTNGDVTVSGLANSDSVTVTVTATGSLTQVGQAENTYAIDWGNAKPGNYTISETLGSLAVEALELSLDLGSVTADYSGAPVLPVPILTYENGPHAGETVSGEIISAHVPGSRGILASTSGAMARRAAPSAVFCFSLFTGDRVDVTVTGLESGVGQHTFSASVSISGDGNISCHVASISGSAYTVSPAALTIATQSASKPYDGTALTAPASVTGLVGGDASIVTVTATGAITEPGMAENPYTIDWGSVNPENYTITETLGALEVTANDTPVTFTAASDEKVYDGQPLTNPEVTAEGLPDGFTFEATVSGSRTDAGESENAVASFMIYNADGQDVTGYFAAVSTLSGTLKVTPAAATVITESASKAYDGTALTAPASITGLTAADEAKVTVTATGAITEPGTAENPYAIDWGGVNPENYTITETLGALEVTANDTPVTFTAASDEKVYDGQPLTNPEVTAEGLPDGFTFEATVSGSRTDAGESENVVASFMIYNADGQDVTGYFAAVSTLSGTLKVTPAAASITTQSASKPYDGTALTAPASITGLVGGDASIVTVTATGAITEPGTAENPYAIDWGGVNPANYAVTDTLGTLTVTANETPVTITAASASKVFDGAALTDASYTVTGLPEGFACAAVINGSQQNAGSSENTVVSYQILDGDENDVTDYFTAVTTVPGTLTVSRLPLTIQMEDGSYPYRGMYASNWPDILCDNADFTLTCDDWTADVPYTHWYITWGWGDVLEFNISAGKDVGTYTCQIDGVTASGTASIDNYEISYIGNPSTYTITKMQVIFWCDPEPTEYVFGESITLTEPNAYYNNSSHGGQHLSPDSSTSTGTSAHWHYTLFTGDEVEIDASLSGYDIGYHDVNVTYTITTGNPANLDIIADGMYEITPAPVTITTASAERAYDGTALTAGVTVSGLAGEPGVYYTDDQRPVVTATGSQTDAGSSTNTYTIDWRAFDPAHYSVTETLGTLTVTPLDVEIRMENTVAPYDMAYHRPAFQVICDADVTIGTDYTPSVRILDAMFQLIRSPDNLKNAGAWDTTCNVNWAYGNQENFNLTVTGGSLTITPVPLTVTTTSASKVFDGTALTGEASITGFTNGEGVAINATGFVTNVGSAANTYAINWNGWEESNYTITESLGTLTVEPLEVEFDLGGFTQEYSGSAIAYGSPTLTYLNGPHAGETIGPASSYMYGGSTGDRRSHTFTLDSGETISLTTDCAYCRNVGEYTITGSCSFSSSESNFTVSYTNGTCVITPAAITVTTESETKVFDGAPLPESTTAPIIGTLYDPIYAMATGYQRDVGSSVNTYSLEGDTSNYTVTENLGTLTVEPLEVEFDLGGTAWDEIVYDGEYHGANFRVSSDEEGFELEQLSDTAWRVRWPWGEVIDVTVTGGGKDAGTYPLTCAYSFSSGNASNYDISIVNDSLTIQKLKIDVVFGDTSLIYGTTGSNDRVYPPYPSCTATYTNGAHAGESPGVNRQYNVISNTNIYEVFFLKTNTNDGLAIDLKNFGADAGTYTLTSSVGLSSSYPDTRKSNFDVTINSPTYTVTPRSIAVTTGSASRAYNGTALTNIAASISNLAKNDEGIITATGTGSITDKGSILNPFTIDWGGISSGNYTIASESLGTLAVTELELRCTLNHHISEGYFELTVDCDTPAFTVNEVGTNKWQIVFDWGDTLTCQVEDGHFTHIYNQNFTWSVTETSTP